MSSQLTPVSAPAGDVDGALDEPRRSRLNWALHEVGLRFVMVWILIIVMLVANAYYPGFFEWGNIRNILSQNAPVGLVAIGMTFVIICGGFDLSVGAIVALAAVLYSGFSNHMSLELAFVLTLGAGLLAGAINGVIITFFKVNAFVATLATASLYTGAALLYSNSGPILSSDPGFTTFGSKDWLGLPIVVWVLGLTFVFAAVLLARTVYGRSVYAVGGNYEAARLAGVRVRMVQGSTYLLTGAAAAVAGMMIASRIGVGQPEISGDITLDAIAIVIIGGTSLLGGEGALWRTMVGLLILATINNLFDSLALNVAAQSIVKGAIVLLAVVIDSFTRRTRV
jgi:ribose transport system permease protein